MRPDDANETIQYEVNLDAEAAIEAPFDTWLRDHIADMLQIDGFLAADVLADPAPPPGRIRRTVQYRLRDQAALDRYLRDDASRMRQHGVALFGERFRAERRTLAHREEFLRGEVSTENCLNCGEVLTGQHCAHCGQHAKVRVLSLGGLLRDVFDDLTNFDSRLWRTLQPLAFRPGWLTGEYLRGRRTLYTPPFRMYLILSVAFFVLTSLMADPGSAMKFELGEDGTNLQIGDGGTATPAAIDDPCGQADIRLDIGPWGKQYEPRLREACRKIVTDSQSFGRALYENIPKMMFIFLPLVAAVMFVLYLGSGRYYVEHLLFFVHYHAFFFLGGIAIVLLDRGSALLAGTSAGPALRVAEGVLTAAFVFYVPWYLYRAMRRVYGQGRLVTLFKYSLLGVGYVVFMALTAVGLLAYTALTL